MDNRPWRKIRRRTTAQTLRQAWLENELDPLLAQLATQADDSVTFHPLLVEFVPDGVHYDTLFGAEVIQHEGLFWSRLLFDDPGSLPRIDLEGE